AGHGVTCDAELPRDGTLRQTLAAVKMPDQGPVFQGDHPSNLIGWPTFQPVATGRVFQPSSTACRRPGPLAFSSPSPGIFSGGCYGNPLVTGQLRKRSVLR